jgi:hypothetical protein
MAGKFILRASGIFALLAAVPFWCVSAEADDFGPNTYAQYGHAVNGYTGTATANGLPIDPNGGFCAATSIANSLQFLANKYGGVYDNLLQSGSATPPPDAVQATRDAIVEDEQLSPNKNNTASDSPANNETIWNSKLEYINGQINPNLISIEGLIDGSVYGTGGYDTTPNSTLTFSNASTNWEQWLQDQIEAGQDVEIAFSGLSVTTDGDGNESLDANNPVVHMVTLAGIDSNADSIEYLDPNAPGSFLTAPFTLATNGELEFRWNNGGNAPADVTVNEAWSESPVPEPALGGLVLLARLVVYRKR